MLPGSTFGAGDAAIEGWIRAARQGSVEALGKLFEATRPYLLLIGNRSLPGDLQAKIGASDLVQETFLNARQRFHQFEGTSEEELLAWLRQVLLNKAANTARQYRGTLKRDVGREVSLGDLASTLPSDGLADPDPTPSRQVAARENDAELELALLALPAHYREVIRLRHRENLSFEEIGRRLDRSAEATRKLWVRAIEQLKEHLGPCHEPG